MKFEDVKKIAVLGSGTMGHGIAQRYAMGGYEVNLYDIADEPLKKAMEQIQENFRTFIEEGVVTETEAKAATAKIKCTTDLKASVEGVQLVQETVPEKPEIKTSVYKQIDEYLPMEGVVIVSNASTLNPFVLIPERRQPMFCTAHWFAPPHILPLVECAMGEETTEDTIETVMAVLEKCGKSAVRLEKFIPGHIISRMLVLLNTELFYLLDNGICTPEMIDKAVKASFFPRGMVVGMVQRYDFTGLDISCNNITNASYVMPETSKHPAQLFDHFDKGELGVKTGKGFFDYSGRDSKEVFAERDRRLIRVLKATKDLIDKPV